MNKKLTVLSTVIGLVGLSGVAHAQDSFGKPMDISFAVERPFGFFWGSARVDPPGQAREYHYDGNGFALGWSQDRNYSPVLAPRFGFDIFVIERLSVGGSLGFISRNLEGDNDDRNGFIFAPRVGYFIDFSDHFGFWPRGGLTFYNLHDSDQDQFLLALEGYFTFAPRDGFGFLFGPTFDFGLGGEAGDSDYNERVFGIMIGMFGWI